MTKLALHLNSNTYRQVSTRQPGYLRNTIINCRTLADTAHRLLCCNGTLGQGIDFPHTCHYLIPQVKNVGLVSA